MTVHVGVQFDHGVAGLMAGDQAGQCRCCNLPSALFFAIGIPEKIAAVLLFAQHPGEWGAAANAVSGYTEPFDFPK